MVTNTGESTGLSDNQHHREHDPWDNDLFFYPYNHQISEGRENGEREGLKAGFRDGYRLGRTTAIDYGMEIGFIRGVSLAFLLAQQETHTDAGGEASERVCQRIQGILKAIEEFPDAKELFSSSRPEQEVAESNISEEKNIVDELAEEERDSETSLVNSSVVDVATKMQTIRARFKLLMVQLGYPHLSLKQVMDDAAACTVEKPDGINSATPVPGTSEW